MDLNIVTLNIPYPPDYGGMIDTFYRIKSLHGLGVRIHLHCFEYGRQHSKELESICETTNYYPRRSGLLKQLSRTPYIVLSRKSKALLDNLNKNDYPILFDGLHTTYYINHPAITNRMKLVRLHNIEHIYYRTLANFENNFLKKRYFLYEAAKLKNYEKVLSLDDYTLPISESENEYFKSRYHNSVLLAPSHPFEGLKSLAGTGEYVIYHGDLSVNENSAIADSLISNVFSKIPYQCVIAGKDPPEFIKSNASRYINVTVVRNPDNDQMMKLIANAHIHLLPVLAANGFKLKLLMALYAGRHCIVSSNITENPSIKNLCHIANSYEEMLNKINTLFKEPFTIEMIIERQKLLSENFDNQNSARELIKLIYGSISKRD